MSSPPETRASLILRLPNAADAAAWEEFVDVYGPLVYRLARQRGLQPADSDDLVQEVLSSVARSVERWLENPDRGRFRAWLLRIARNTAINFLTRRKHRPIATGDDNAQWLEQVAAPDARPSNESREFDLEYRREVFHWAAEQIREAVSETTWRAFRMTSIEDRPIAVAAEELGVSVGSVYIARSRVMARLRQLVSQFEADES